MDQDDRDGFDREMMEKAIALAQQAATEGEVPVGAVLVEGREIVAGGANRVETGQDSCAHAEMVVLRKASEKTGKKWLTGTTLYVTLEPCAMCAGAIVLARVARVVFGAGDPKAGAMGSVYEVGVDGRLNHTPEVTGGVLAAECGKLLTDFFRQRR